MHQTCWSRLDPNNSTAAHFIIKIVAWDRFDTYRTWRINWQCNPKQNHKPMWISSRVMRRLSSDLSFQISNKTLNVKVQKHSRELSVDNSKLKYQRRHKISLLTQNDEILCVIYTWMSLFICRWSIDQGGKSRTQWCQTDFFKQHCLYEDKRFPKKPTGDLYFHRWFNRCRFWQSRQATNCTPSFTSTYPHVISHYITVCHVQSSYEASFLCFK